MKVTIKPNSNIFENLMWNKEMIEDIINKNASKYIKSIFIEETNINKQR